MVVVCQEKNCPPKNFILGQKFSATELKINFCPPAKFCLTDFSSALHVAILLHSSPLYLILIFYSWLNVYMYSFFYHTPRMITDSSL